MSLLPPPQNATTHTSASELLKTGIRVGAEPTRTQPSLTRVHLSDPGVAITSVDAEAA